MPKYSYSRVKSLEKWIKRAKPGRHSFIVEIIKFETSFKNQSLQSASKSPIFAFNPPIRRNVQQFPLIISDHAQRSLSRSAETFGRLICKGHYFIVEIRG